MLSLAWAGILGGDRVGLFAFDARPRAFQPPEGAVQVELKPPATAKATVKRKGGGS